MRRATTRRHAPDAKMILSPLLACTAFGLAVTNTHGVILHVTVATFALALVSTILALLIIKNVLQHRSPWWGVSFALGGAAVAVLAGLLAWGVLAMERGTDRRMTDANNLKRLTVALLAYEKAHGRLPPAAVTAKDGTPLLSWRVLILPYLER